MPVHLDELGLGFRGYAPEEGQRILARSKGIVTVIPAPDLSCAHRGPEIRLKGCKTCGGNVQIKVFSCDVHAECTLGQLDGMASCATCPDRYESASIPLNALPTPAAAVE